MLEVKKQELVEATKQHITHIRERIVQVLAEKEAKTGRMSKDAVRMSAGDAIVQRKIVAHNQEQTEDLKQLYPSPYFTKCEFEVKGEKKTMYFSKFSFSEEGVYSWITPAATLRFENPGPAAYNRLDGKIQSGILHAKDQYMIVDGKLLFFSTESTAHARELVYQEHFTRQKQGFILPEVVEQMEKAQDQVVRAHYRGPFVISGPAGSGKTTLALHRVAYLAQSPETAEYFTPEMVLVLVQDQGTKDYFSHLLPELGIHGVLIRTFAEWAFTALGLEGYTYRQRYGATESEQIQYEYAKLSALKNGVDAIYNKNVFSVLQKVYEKFFDGATKKMFKQQKDERVLDRFDLTIILSAFQKARGAFVVEKEYYEELANGSYRKRKGSFPMHYNLAIIDEFQNYLPEQLALIKSCLNHRLESVVYVGDIAQQTQLGTVRDWSHVGGQLPAERLVTLQKVYRNTKQILHYIRDLGFSVAVPPELKEGKAVVEKMFSTAEQECLYIKSTIAEVGNATVGILSKNKNYLSSFKEFFGSQENIFCLSFQEAQGVEFDAVFIVGVEKEMFGLQNIPEQIADEVKKIQKDLLYVALTRAMTELHILGSNKLTEIVSYE